MVTQSNSLPAFAVVLALFPARELRGGQLVAHWLFGLGRVIEEWGNFRACKVCYREAPLGSEQRSILINGQVLVEKKPVHCAVNGCDGPTHVISGSGIYDVVFEDGKTRSINGIWLTMA